VTNPEPRRVNGQTLIDVLGHGSEEVEWREQSTPRRRRTRWVVARAWDCGCAAHLSRDLPGGVFDYLACGAEHLELVAAREPLA
jgi:hypothetical protein